MTTPRRVVLVERPGGRWSVEPDVGEKVEDLAGLWEAGQVAASLGETETPRPRRRRRDR